MSISSEELIKIKIPNTKNITIHDIGKILGKEYYVLCESYTDEDHGSDDHFMNIISDPNKIIKRIKKSADKTIDQAEFYESDGSIYVSFKVASTRIYANIEFSLHGLNRKERKKIITKLEKIDIDWGNKKDDDCMVSNLPEQNENYLKVVHIRK